MGRRKKETTPYAAITEHAKQIMDIATEGALPLPVSNHAITKINKQLQEYPGFQPVVLKYLSQRILEAEKMGVLEEYKKAEMQEKTTSMLAPAKQPADICIR